MNRKPIKTSITVRNNDVDVLRIGDIDYISLTSLAKYQNPEFPANVIIHWLSNKTTFDYVGLWEELNNPNFNLTEFREIKINECGRYSFTMSPRRWIKDLNAIGIVSKGGKYSIGTFAHPDIAFEFASWLSPEFKLYLIKEFERLKKNEAYQYKIEWRANREIAAANYLIHTDAIKENIIPTLSDTQKKFAYATEADVLNVALFGMTAKEWRDENPELAEKGLNIRDEADLLHLIILSNLEGINAELINSGTPQSERLVRLNIAAKKQVEILAKNRSVKKLEQLEQSTNRKLIMDGEEKI